MTCSSRNFHNRQIDSDSSAMAGNTVNYRGASEQPRSFADSQKPKSSRIDFLQIKPDTRVFHFDPNPLSNLRHPDANLITTTMAVGVPERLLNDTEDRRLQWWSQPLELHLDGTFDLDCLIRSRPRGQDPQWQPRVLPRRVPSGGGRASAVVPRQSPRSNCATRPNPSRAESSISFGKRCKQPSSVISALVTD